MFATKQDPKAFIKLICKNANFQLTALWHAPPAIPAATTTGKLKCNAPFSAAFPHPHTPAERAQVGVRWQVCERVGNEQVAAGMPGEWQPNAVNLVTL